MLFSHTADTEDCFEIISLQFKSDTSLKQQQAAMLGLNDLVSILEGFKSRDYFYSEDNGRWVEFISWSNADLAKQASEAMMKNEQALALFSLIDQTSMIFSHYQHVGGISPQTHA